MDVVLLEVGIGGLLDTTNSDRESSQYHFSWPRSPGKHWEGQCGAIAQQKAGIFSGQESCSGPFYPMKLQFVCQERAGQLAVDLHAFQKDFGLEQDRFWNKNVELVFAVLGLKGDTNGSLFPPHGGADQEVDMDQVKLAYKRRGGWTSRVVWLNQVYLDGAHNPHAMLRLIEFQANSLAGKRSTLFGALKLKRL